MRRRDARLHVERADPQAAIVGQVGLRRLGIVGQPAVMGEDDRRCAGSPTSSSGANFSARLAVRKRVAGEMQPTMPGSAMARSNSATAASTSSPPECAAKALRRSGYCDAGGRDRVVIGAAQRHRVLERQRRDVLQLVRQDGVGDAVLVHLGEALLDAVEARGQGGPIVQQRIHVFLAVVAADDHRRLGPRAQRVGEALGDDVANACRWSSSWRVSAGGRPPSVEGANGIGLGPVAQLPGPGGCLGHIQAKSEHPVRYRSAVPRAGSWEASQPPPSAWISAAVATRRLCRIDERGLLVAERGGLGDDHAGIGDRAGLVLVEGQLLGLGAPSAAPRPAPPPAARGCAARRARPRPAGTRSARSGDRSRRSGRRAARAASTCAPRRPPSKIVSRRRGAERPGANWTADSRLPSALAGEAGRRGQGEIREIGRLGDADLRVGRRHGALGGGDVGPPLQQRRRHAGRRHRHGRVPSGSARARCEKSAGGLPISTAIACSNCARCTPTRDLLRLGVLELGLGRHHVGLGGDARRRTGSA